MHPDLVVHMMCRLGQRGRECQIAVDAVFHCKWELLNYVVVVVDLSSNYACYLSVLLL